MGKKNQMIITALAIMIAVAGYLNFAGTKVNKEDMVKKTEGKTSTEVAEAGNQEDANIDVSDISDEDIYAAEQVADGDMADMTSGAEGTYKDYTEIQSLDSDSDVLTAENKDESIPGEAVLTGSSTVGVGVVANAKLLKEQSRAKNKETLLDVINNETITDDAKQTAINEMIAMTDITERETAAEILLAAKGFHDAIVSITGNSADVVINSPELSDSERAQIEDIVKRKTGVNAENLVITPLSE